MRGLRRVFIAIPITLILSIFITGFTVISELTSKREALDTYIRIATKDAIINVQTTEQEGLNFSSATEYDKRKYEIYLEQISNQLNGKDSKETLNMLYSFLNNNNQQNNNGDALFRPIQFGMTYLDKELFEESFKKSLLTLVESNHNINSSTDYKLMCNDSLHIYEEYIRFEYNGPIVVQYIDGSNSGDESKNSFLRQLYGADEASAHIAEYNAALSKDSTDLGISTSSVPKFYIYYDIDIYVPWGSSTAIQILSKSFLEDKMKIGNLEYSIPPADSSDTQQFLRWRTFSLDGNEVDKKSADNGTVQHYSYRYVLLN